MNLQTPPGIGGVDGQGEFFDVVGDLNKIRLEAVGDPEIKTRIAAYEMAYRMQTSAPELMDLSDETQETLDLYGVTPGQPSYAANCLMARRLVTHTVEGNTVEGHSAARTHRRWTARPRTTLGGRPSTL